MNVVSNEQVSNVVISNELVSVVCTPSVDAANMQGFVCSFIYIMSNSIENSNTSRDNFPSVGNVNVV